MTSVGSFSSNNFFLIVHHPIKVAEWYTGNSVLFSAMIDVAIVCRANVFHYMISFCCYCHTCTSASCKYEPNSVTTMTLSTIYQPSEVLIKYQDAAQLTI